MSKFCPECGTQRPDPAQPWACPKCGNQNPSTAKFCSECGTQH